MGKTEQFEVLLPARCTAAEAAALIDACTADLAADNAVMLASTAERLLEKRSIALAESLEPSDWHQELSNSAQFTCGCEWRCAGRAYGRAIDPEYVRVCDLHERAEEVAG